MAIADNDSSNTATNDTYSFKAYVPALTTTSNITFGTTYSGTVVNPGDTHVYTFTGKPGQQVYLDGLTGQGLSAHIFDPNGDVVAGYTGSQLFELTDDSGPLTLTTTGADQTYQLVIGGYAQSGPFSFRLLESRRTRPR